MMQLMQVAEATSGSLLGIDALITDVVTDARIDCSGGLFVALKGDNFDAHDFVGQAKTAGAAAVLVEREVETDLPAVLVDNTLAALALLAQWWRNQFDIPVMAITGSVGKTTVKEMLASIFARLGKGVATKGNLNNEIGVPLTLLRLREFHKYAIVEMGMNHAGEIRRLTNMAQPTVALVNNAGAAHLEGLGSVAAVAQAKGEIFEGLGENGVAIINADDDYSDLWQQSTEHYKKILFGLEDDAHISASHKANGHQMLIDITGLREPCQLQLNSMGKHSVLNALAAVAVASAVNVSVLDIIKGLEAFSSVSGRLSVERIGEFVLIDDSYNANPTSMRAAIDVLASYANSFLILGDMAELGSSAEQEHKKLGAYAYAKGIKQLCACGHYSNIVVSEFLGDGKAYPDQAALLDSLASALDEQIVNLESRPGPLAVLAKGSRSAKMENVVSAARAHLLTSSNSNFGGA